MGYQQLLHASQKLDMLRKSACHPSRPSPALCLMASSVTATETRGADMRIRPCVPHPVQLQAPVSVREIAVNHAIPDCNIQLHLDILVTDKDKKRVLNGVTIPFENRWQVFTEAWEQKLLKYRPVADTMWEKSYMMVQVLIAGSLGAWDPSNRSVL